MLGYSSNSNVQFYAYTMIHVYMCTLLLTKTVIVNICFNVDNMTKSNLFISKWMNTILEIS